MKVRQKNAELYFKEAKSVFPEELCQGVAASLIIRKLKSHALRGFKRYLKKHEKVQEEEKKEEEGVPEEIDWGKVTHNEMPRPGTKIKQ